MKLTPSHLYRTFWGLHFSTSCGGSSWTWKGFSMTQADAHGFKRVKLGLMTSWKSCQGAENLIIYYWHLFWKMLTYLNWVQLKTWKHMHSNSLSFYTVERNCDKKCKISKIQLLRLGIGSTLPGKIDCHDKQFVHISWKIFSKRRQIKVGVIRCNFKYTWKAYKKKPYRYCVRVKDRKMSLCILFIWELVIQDISLPIS